MTSDSGLSVSWIVLRRQIEALPCLLYELRLIHGETRHALPGVRHWTAAQLLDPATVRFLRLRNREGYDVYFRPYTGPQNAGYVLLDLDRPTPDILHRLHAQGHEPSVVVQTSPGHWQAWIRVSRQPLWPVPATRISRHLARLYAADPASADWRHLGRLAGLTNRKPQRLQSSGLAPWVKLIYARPCLASAGAELLAQVAADLALGSTSRSRPPRPQAMAWLPLSGLESTALEILYRDCLHRLRILERYPRPDWSIADHWVARELLRQGTPWTTIAAVLRHGSPGFPRGHADPEDYLRRTLHRAAR
jgi:hypothetical protein